MRTITVCASKQYDIRIGAGLLDTVGEEVAVLGGAARICVVSDSNVFPLYGAKVIHSLENAGFTVCSFVFPAGEENKNAETFLALLNEFAAQKLSRSDMIVALGGGVVGDLAGFAAACYLRGIRFVQLPTTLLAAVDSSVGGKTAIDLPTGKNLAGAFCQPSLVICDIDTLKTLPDDVFRDGCAEVIKYAVLYDPELFDTLRQQKLCFDREQVIARCVELKRNVVMEDEFDTGSRMKLNLGHTIGHGVEAKSCFSVSHGKAVAIGMAIVAQGAEHMAFCNRETCENIHSILKSFGLPTTTEYSTDELYDYTLSDKKRSGNVLHLIIPREIGNCEIYPIPVSDLKSFIKAGR